MLQKSETIGALAGALAKAQAKIQGAKKDSENPFFKSKYADLSAVWDACRASLTENEIAVIQTPSSLVTETATVISLGTLLTHSSGEWIYEELSAVPVKDDPQGIGSCVTYLRRYALSAFTGVAPEDDDGNAASSPGQPAKPRTLPTKAGDAEREGLMLAIKGAAKTLNSLGDDPAWTSKRANDFANENFNVKGGVDALTNPQLNEMAKLLSARVDELKKPKAAPNKADDRTESERVAKLSEIRKNFKAPHIAQGMEATYPGRDIESLTLDELIRLADEIIPF